MARPPASGGRPRGRASEATDAGAGDPWDEATDASRTRAPGGGKVQIKKTHMKARDANKNSHTFCLPKTWPIKLIPSDTKFPPGWGNSG